VKLRVRPLIPSRARTRNLLTRLTDTRRRAAQCAIFSRFWHTRFIFETARFRAPKPGTLHVMIDAEVPRTILFRVKADSRDVNLP
jgi:hypothetical protein